MGKHLLLSALWTTSLLVASSAFTVLRQFSAESLVPLLASPNVGDSTGEVVSDPGGRIMGCTITPVEGSILEWNIQIDGVQADLGKFSAVIHRKILADAKTQRFQGFRPGTIPPHLLRTYRAYTMDECAREATLEALAQNNIRAFDETRSEMRFSDFNIPPPRPKKTGGKKKKNKKANDQIEDETPTEDLQWRFFETMEGAIGAGWEPGQSFSFVATAKGQKLKDQDLSGAKPLAPY